MLAIPGKSVYHYPMHRLSYKLLLSFTVLAALGGILTLMPRSGASYPNILGYRSLCTFAPGASLYCFFLAGLSCFIRSTFIKDQSGRPNERIRRHTPRLIPLLFVLVLAVSSTLWFSQVKSGYLQEGLDGSTAATLPASQ